MPKSLEKGMRGILPSTKFSDLAKLTNFSPPAEKSCSILLLEDSCGLESAHNWASCGRSAENAAGTEQL